MSKLSDDTKENSNSEMIPENMLYEIFETQYDDLFCKILKISEQSFKYFLQQQVLFNLLIIQKQYDESIITAFQELFIKRYKENYKAMKKNFELLKNKENDKSEDLKYLDFTKCYIHCHKCYSIIHKCGSKLILYDSYIYCIKCNNVYNKNQIMLFCPECKKNYFTKLRKPVFNNNKKFEKLFILKYKDYHCPTEKEEKIKCLKCSNNLYYRHIINNPKNEECINTIYCIKCKLKYNLKDVFFKCKICLNNFKCQAKIYRDFPNKKKKLLFIVHTLLRNKKALPNISLSSKRCKCDINDITEYTHNDNGILLEGVKNNKKEVICNKCFQIFEYNEIDWKCPKCGDVFRHKDINTSKNKSLKKGINDNNNKNKADKIGKNKIKKIPVFKININNINKDKEDEINDYVIKTEASENRIINSKRVSKKDSSINVDNSNKYEKLKKIFSSKKCQKNEKNRFLMVRSKSKNELARNKDKVETINSIYKKEKEKEKENIINIVKKNNNNKDVNNNAKNNINNTDKKNYNINDENSTNINSKEIKKNENKTIDTTKIFNNIKNNIFNLEEYYSNLNYYQKEPKKRIRTSNKIINPKCQNVKNEAFLQVKPKEKNSLNFNEQGLYQEGNFQYNTSGDFSNYNNVNDNNMVNNRKIDSIEDYESIQNIEEKRKPNINYAKKIFLYDKRVERDNRSYDQKVNFKKFKINNLFTKYEGNNNNKITNNIINYNNFYNNYQYLFNNINPINYQNNSNYNNYYFNEENYGMNNQQINLYNFNSQNYSIIKILGKGSNGKIYLVQDIQTQQRFALKSVLIDNETDLKEKEEQYNLIYRLAYENPQLRIVNIFGLEIRKVDKYNTFLNVLMEKAEYDWETEISRRKKTKNYYTEDELFYILSNLVATFAILQQKGVSHRDVKPQNILYFGNNQYKICDFGEAKYKERTKFGNNFNNLDSSNQTIRGTEMYMSPILFRAVKFRPDSLTKYNSFKSDVFSLGLCFLYAGSLDLNVLFKVRDVLDMQKISIIVNQYLGRRYSQEFIGILIYMLQVDERYRPDFIELNSWIAYGNY